MSTKEIVVNMLDSLSEAQIESIKMLIESFTVPKVQDWKNIEEVEPDEWDKEMIENNEKTVKSVRGSLSKYANPDLIPLEEGAWENAVAEKSI